jgi:L-asparaginase
MFFSRPSGRYGLHSEFAVEENVTGFPQVEILYGYADMGRAAIDNAVQRGVKGIVIAGVGNGSIPHITSEALAEAVKRGVVVVRSSRVISGFVAPNREVDDDRLGFVASPELNPQKSRVLLMLALQKTSSRKDLQQIFYQY